MDTLPAKFLRHVKKFPRANGCGRSANGFDTLAPPPFSKRWGTVGVVGTGPSGLTRLCGTQSVGFLHNGNDFIQRRRNIER